MDLHSIDTRPRVSAFYAAELEMARLRRTIDNLACPTYPGNAPDFQQYMRRRLDEARAQTREVLTLVQRLAAELQALDRLAHSDGPAEDRDLVSARDGHSGEER